MIETVRAYLARVLRDASMEPMRPMESQRLRLLAGALDLGDLSPALASKLDAVAPIGAPREFPGRIGRD